MNRAQGEQIAEYISTSRKRSALAYIKELIATETGAYWKRDLAKLYDVIATDVPGFSIFSKTGNSKLPFLSFSALPGVDNCPGAGECLNFCYSFKAWRYSAAFCRQAQNSWLLKSITGRAAIKKELATFKPALGESIDFRLYVDGDFRNELEVNWWMFTLHNFPWLKTYGYSKSWTELLSFDRNSRGSWPANYQLNLSSGSHHDAAIRAKVAALPIARGEFVVVPVGYKVTSDMHNNREHQAKLRAAYGKKAFTCPGKCGTCTNAGHACGSDRFKDIPIIIAAH